MKSVYIFLAVLALCFISCDPPIFQVPIDGTYKKEIGFECGKIDMECNTIGGISFNIKQVYHIINSINISPKSLSIKHKDKDIKYTIYLNGIAVNKLQNVLNDDIVVISFAEKVSNNDTITINLDNFLYCNEKPINAGDIYFVFNNN
jgi:hypothetical protein